MRSTGQNLAHPPISKQTRLLGDEPESLSLNTFPAQAFTLSIIEDNYILSGPSDNDAILYDIAFNVVVSSIRCCLSLLPGANIFTNLSSQLLRFARLGSTIPHLPVHVIRFWNIGCNCEPQTPFLQC